ncbi:MAG: transglycosylase SLT domain-containing protein [Actinomycetota bacterium]
MGPRRAAAAFFLFLLTLSLVPVVVHAQATGVEEAQTRKDDADRLVSAAVANRGKVEIELQTALASYQALAVQISEMGASVDRLSRLVLQAEAQVETLAASAADNAVEAYIEALTRPGGVLILVGTVEDTMIASPTLQFLAGADREEAAGLKVTRRDLEALRLRHLGELQQLAAFQEEMNEAADRLQQIFAEADAEVASAIAAARLADIEYRLALDEVERARAAQEEQARQAERTTTTTTGTSSTAPTATTVPGAGKPLKPAVERWRSLVASHFRSEWVDSALRIMQCESLGDPGAYNPYSGASGLFQFLPGTWAVVSPKAGFGGASAFDPEANTVSAAWLANYYEGQGKSPWTPWHCKP